MLAMLGAAEIIALKSLMAINFRLHDITRSFSIDLINF